MSFKKIDDGTARGNGQTPQVSVDFTISNIGYQMDLYINGKLAEIECRDFSGAPSLKKAVEPLIRRIHKTVDEWRQSL